MASGVSRKRLDSGEEFPVKRKINEGDEVNEMLVDTVAQAAFGLVADQKEPSHHEFYDLSMIEKRIQDQVKDVFTADESSNPLIDCEYALWIQQAVAHIRSTSNADTRERINRILLSQLQNCIETHKKNIPASAASQEQADFALKQLWYNIGSAFLSKLSGFLSKEGKEQALNAAASEGAIDVMKILLENGPISEDLKKQVFNWSIEQGCQEIFFCLAEQICATRQARTEAMWVALNAGRFDMLEPIFSFGTIAEKDRQEAIAKTRQVGYQELLVFLKSSRSKLIGE